MDVRFEDQPDRRTPLGASATTEKRSVRLSGVEAGRGVASLLVLLLHATHIRSDVLASGGLPFAGLFEFGHAGVDFFFVLSGFIIYFIHHEDIGKPGAVRAYAVKRAIRIYPIYWVVLAILGAILALSPSPDRSEQQLGEIVSSVLLLPGQNELILGVAWSLRHELIFYFLFAVLIMNRRVGWILLSAWGIATAANVFAIFFADKQLFSGVAGSLFFRIFNLEFFVGLLAGRVVLHGRLPFPRLLALVGVVLFLSGGIYEAWVSTAPPEWLPRHFVYAVGAGLTIAGLAAAERDGKAALRVPRPLLILGQASYSLYLTHVIVVILVAYSFRRLPGIEFIPAEIPFLVAVTAALAVGIAFCFTVELPLLRLCRRHLLGAAPASAIAPASQRAAG